MFAVTQVTPLSVTAYLFTTMSALLTLIDVIRTGIPGPSGPTPAASVLALTSIPAWFHAYGWISRASSTVFVETKAMLTVTHVAALGIAAGMLTLVCSLTTLVDILSTCGPCPSCTTPALCLLTYASVSTGWNARRIITNTRSTITT